MNRSVTKSAGTFAESIVPKHGLLAYRFRHVVEAAKQNAELGRSFWTREEDAVDCKQRIEESTGYTIIAVDNLMSWFRQYYRIPKRRRWLKDHFTNDGSGRYVVSPWVPEVTQLFGSRNREFYFLRDLVQRGKVLKVQRKCKICASRCLEGSIYFGSKWFCGRTCFSKYEDKLCRLKQVKKDLRQTPQQRHAKALQIARQASSEIKKLLHFQTPGALKSLREECETLQTFLR